MIKNKIKSFFFFKKYKEKIAKIRGYNYLKKNNRLSIWRKIREEIFLEEPFIKGPFSKTIFGSAIQNSNLILKQYCADRFLVADWLNDSILKYFGDKSRVLDEALPFQWIGIIKKHGIEISQTKSVIKFWIYILLFYILGIVYFLKILYKSIFSNTLKNKICDNSVYFHRLNNSNIPAGVQYSYDIISWYLNSKIKKTNIKTIYHNVNCFHAVKENVNVLHQNIDDLFIVEKKYIVTFFLWFVKAYSIVTRDILMLRWWHALIFYESIKAQTVNYSSNLRKINEHYFHWSGGSYRPLWTYTAENFGCESFCYFYSTAETPSIGMRQSNIADFGLLSWPKILVWDNFQATHISSSSIYKSNIEVCGPIWFSDNSVDLPDIPKKSIAIFDIQPFKNSLHCPWSATAEYRAGNPRLHKEFLDDLLLLISKNNYYGAHKIKRYIGRAANGNYINHIKLLRSNSKYIAINEGVSPVRLIKNCAAVVSMPFTATAIYAQNLGKPNIYYDPTGWIQKNDPAAHGVPIISGKEELRVWFETLMQNK